VILNDEFEILGDVQKFVRPVKNRVLSDFCRRLTSITQSQVDSVSTFPGALRGFQEQVEKLSGQRLSNLVLCSWGNYDREQLMQDCRYHRISYPFGPHRSLKHEFAERHAMRPIGMRRALRLWGIPFEGTNHRAIDDARNLARLFRREWGEIRKNEPRIRS
jgi:inhibitor of KinA sporulation pathway (predicted exonuclease)